VQLTLRILVLSLLALVWMQDLRYRAVSWVIFPLLLLGVAALRLLSGEPLADAWPAVVVNSGILLMILLLLTLYVLIKYRKLVNITDQYLGSGDILFFGVTAFALSILNFLFFLVTSLICTGLLQLVWWAVNKNKHVPLAGLQALFLLFFLSSDWWYFHHGLTDDNWLLQLYTPWIRN
jgi:Flp pilus assembly protein protease CpaA